MIIDKNGREIIPGDYAVMSERPEFGVFIVAELKEVEERESRGSNRSRIKNMALLKLTPEYFTCLVETQDLVTMTEQEATMYKLTHTHNYDSN